MRQVPHYLIIGNGRVSRHFQHYFSLLNISFTVWHRRESSNTLQPRANAATHILLLINDDAIDEFIQLHLRQSKAQLIHFSGTLVSQHAYGTHPLMTFNHELYTLEQYQAIPFVIDHDAPLFEELFPSLPNSHVRLQKSLKAKYHALCVLSGNFSCMLWQKLFSTFENEFNIPPEIGFPYLNQQAKNILTNPKTALTGPLVRNDKRTIEKNLMELQGDPFQAVYKSFVACYQQLTNEG